MSFPLPDNLLRLPETTLKMVMKKVVGSQNGDISRTMKRMGYDYPINYGVVLPRLRSIAETFEPSHYLAVQLRGHNHIREALILSSMLDEPEKVTTNEAIEICTLITNVELAEQFSRNLLALIPNLNIFLNKIFGTTEMNNATAFLTFGWAKKLKRQTSEAEITWIVETIEHYILADNPRINSAAAFAMQAISECSCYSGNKIHELAVRLSKSENPSIARIGDEFLWMNTI